MKTDAEIEAEERARAERELQKLGSRASGFTPLAGMTRRRMEESKEGPFILVFAGIMLLALVIVLLAMLFGPVLGAAVFWLAIVLLVVGLLIGIFVRLGKH